MDPFSMVVAIVAISVAAGVVNTWIKSRNRERPDDGLREELSGARQDIAKLKERVRVLEEIVTDKDRQLSDDIRRLG
ncbi:hypothetical protein [Hyphomonas sp.]|uniref:hypothetical protein n=1 Tax=Hyphomonas sp. TaxID=87 RepID=UPI00391B22DC